MGTLGQESTIRRTEGVTETVAEQYPGLVNLASETGEWTRDQAVTITENLITTYSDELNVIFSNNDEMALGALQAIETNGREDIKIIGVDAIKDAVDAIKNGRLAGTIFQDAEGQGAAAVQVAFDVINNSFDGEQVTLIDYQLVSPDNVSEYE